ncbi:glycosyltransferase [Clostridium ljungdahlii]|uniref:Chondroitin synthase n=1 Tax=Clostridium ljungdahlii TaxID=1538 RepID=A0A166R8J9_9CLOT|nr:glycosyltransferase [Clostridium ljungdahlii]OAA90631.1 Chondroitin synthase [Clostridium ljungdahlii]
MDSKANLVKNELKDNEQINSAANKIDGEHTQPISSLKLKLVFFVKQGMDVFLDDIINGLSNEYINRKIVVTDYNQIDTWMQWADICFFEWCDELVIYGSRLPISKEKKIICRLHSYEAFTSYPNNVQWNNIDVLIFVGEYIKKFVVNKFKISDQKVVVVPNGIDISKWTFEERKPGFNIAYVGYINYKKGPMLLMHTFKAIYDKDCRYKLFIAGQFQDDRDVLYFHQMIKEFGMEKNVVYEGWQDNLDKWLEDKNYILCTSILESQNVSVMQAMSKGIKPLVHNFVGAKTVYPKEYVWNTIDEAIDMIQSDRYDSGEYRNYISDNYGCNKQMSKIRQIIKNIKIGNKIKQQKFDYKQYWNNRLNSKFDIEGVGYIGLGQIYNEFLYKSRFEILEYIIKNLIKTIKYANVLELGPGIGMFTNYFYKNGFENYCGIDISEKSQKELSRKYIKYKFMLGDISEKGIYPKDKYDLILAADVLLHLTDEEKYKCVVKNLSNVLKDTGYIITFNPITVINSKSESPHLVIRDIKYVENILKENDLEAAGMLPSTFFMNYPFDRNILKDKSDIAQNIFNLIQSIFSNPEICDDSKRDIAEWISLLDKQCLINNKFGLSQKVLIIKKKSNQELFNFSISDVWNYNNVRLQSIEKETLLNKDTRISKYNLINLLKNDIGKLINLNDKHDLEIKPLVTVGITVYNCKKYLKKCVDSYLNQSYSNIEILLIDDCSTDGSKEIIREYENNYSNVKGIYHKLNSGGASQGLQEIIKNAKGKYFQWIACDDFAEKNAVEIFVHYLEKNPDKDYVYSNFNTVDENDIKKGEWNYRLPDWQDAIRYIFFNASGIIPMNCMYRLKFFKKNGITWIVYKGNDFSADTLNSLQFIKYGWNYGRVDKNLINYRIHSNNASHNLEKRIKTLVSVFDYIIKNFSEEIYFSQIDWNNVQNREQFKNYMIAKYYYDQFNNNLSGKAIPGYLNVSVTKEELRAYCGVFLKEGMKYINEGLNQGETYKAQINKLKNEYENYTK